MPPRARALRLAPDVRETLRTLHPLLKRRLRRALDRLRVAPDAGKALTGELSGWRSLRVGRIRVMYRPQRTVIDIAAIGPRASIYVEAAVRLRRRQEPG